MYDPNIVCTYKLIDCSDDADDLYRVQLLQALGLEQYEDAAVLQAVNDLYTMVKTNNSEQLDQILMALRESERYSFLSVFADDNESLFMFLFGFETFAEANKWFSSVLRKGPDTAAAHEKLLAVL